MPESEFPDYTEDWRRYWGFRYKQRIRRRLEKAAENPTNQFLPVKPTQLNPADDDYEWSIEIEHLRENPDSVLHDARTGFSEFVSDQEITDEWRDYYDVLPVNFTENQFDLRGYFWGPSSLESFEPNTVSRISVNLTSQVDRLLKPAAISYECPDGHQNRIPQQIYDSRVIEICPENGCTNSVYSISQGTQFQRVVQFDGVFNGVEIECVAAGLYTQDRTFEELSGEDGSLNLVGILRNVVDTETKPKRVFEVLSMPRG